MKKLFLMMALLATPAFGVPFLVTKPASCKQECPPHVKKPAQTKAVVVHKAEAAKCCAAETKTESQAKADAASHAATGNQTITINMPQPTKVVTRRVTRIKHVDREVRVYVYKPNRLQLLIGESKTKLAIKEDACGCSLSASRKYEPDFGLQYLRDFGGFTGSLAGTMNKSFYLGLGFNW